MAKSIVRYRLTLCECGSDEVRVYVTGETVYQVDPTKGRLEHIPVLDHQERIEVMCYECDAILSDRFEVDLQTLTAKLPNGSAIGGDK